MSTIKKSIGSFKYAFKGLYVLFRNEHNIRVDAFAAVLVTGLGFIVNLSGQEWAVIALCIGLVFTAEAVNSAIERMVDKVSPEQNDLAGVIKDLAAGAVLLAAIAAAAAGLIIFIPKLIGLL